MRFMNMVISKENAGPPPMELMIAIGQLGEEAARAGVMVEMGGLMPVAAGARVKLANGRITVTDGPFAEAREVVGGYAVYDLPSKEDAIYWAKRFMELHQQHWPGWEGEAEVRQLYENNQGPPAQP